MDLSTLFRWTGELEVLGRDGEPVMSRNRPLILYQRIIGDADVTIARKHALKASRDLRRLLKDRKSDSYAALVPDYTEMDDTVLRNSVILSEALELRQRALDTIERPRKPLELTSDATLEDRENYLTETEEYDKMVDDLLNEKFEQLAKTRKEQLEQLDKDTLVDLFLVSIVESLCRAEMLRIFNTWCAYLGTYSNKQMNKRAFKSYHNFDNAASELKSLVIGGYMRLEIEGETLKN